MDTVNEQEAFLRMVDECRGTLYKVCLMFSSRQYEDLRDLYQEVVCHLWEGYKGFGRRSSSHTWVYRVAMNTALSWQRSWQRHDLLVAQLVLYLIGNDMYANMVMLQVKDSVSFLRLLDEFGFGDELKDRLQISKERCFLGARHRYDPTKAAPMNANGKLDVSKSCMVIGYPGYLTFWIAHIKNEAESDQLRRITIDHISDGKMFELR